VTYVGLGARTASGAADTTGFNAGNWTVQFTPQVVNVNVAHFECYKLIVKGAAATATFDVYVNTNQWDTAVYAVHNSWDPTQPLLLTPGDYLYFYYSTASSDGNKPTITAWFRYDPALTDIYAIKLCPGRHNRLSSSWPVTRSSTSTDRSPTRRPPRRGT